MCLEITAIWSKIIIWLSLAENHLSTLLGFHFFTRRGCKIQIIQCMVTRLLYSKAKTMATFNMLHSWYANTLGRVGQVGREVVGWRAGLTLGRCTWQVLWLNKEESGRRGKGDERRRSVWLKRSRLPSLDLQCLSMYLLNINNKNNHSDNNNNINKWHDVKEAAARYRWSNSFQKKWKPK